MAGGAPDSLLLSKFDEAGDAGAGVDGAEGIAGDVILSRESGSCEASAGGSGVGVDESIVSRYGSASPEDSENGV